MSEKKPFVSVVMSAYNGEKYISEQIDSILDQKGVEVNLVIRDDGSTDSTIQVIERYLDRGNVKLIRGENVGFGHSFMRALFECPQSDYYAFSDQDDVWLQDKLIKTINNMDQNHPDRPQLGFCNSLYTDESLNILSGVTPIDSGFVSREMGFVRCLACGFLVVINDPFFILLKMAGSDIPTYHDMWIGGVAGYLADVHHLDEGLVYHRRLDGSLSRLTLPKLFRNRIKALLSDLGVNIPCAELMLKAYSDRLTPDEIEYFTTVTNYRNSLKDKFKLIKNKGIVYPRRYGRIVPKIKVLLNRF